MLELYNDAKKKIPTTSGPLICKQYATPPAVSTAARSVALLGDVTAGERKTRDYVGKWGLTSERKIIWWLQLMCLRGHGRQRHT